jgi:lysophospholipase L1-like esterase
MHGWGYSEAQYQAAFPELLHSVHKLIKPDGVAVWASITPVKVDAKTGATNPRIDVRNSIAASLVQAAGIAFDDQHALMMQHLDRYQDTVHFNPSGAAFQGDQVAETIKAALARIHR